MAHLYICRQPVYAAIFTMAGNMYGHVSHVVWCVCVCVCLLLCYHVFVLVFVYSRFPFSAICVGLAVKKEVG